MSDFLYRCSVCERETVSAKAAEIGADACCMVCAVDHNRPGRFQQYYCEDSETFLNHYAEKMGKCLLLSRFSMDGAEDDRMYQEGWGSLERFDNFLLNVDSQGFYSFEEFDDAIKAGAEFDKMFATGWGAQEDDIYVTCNWNEGWTAWQDGKKIPCHARRGHEYDDRAGIDRRRVLAAVSIHMRKTGYYPNIWEEGERGGLTLIGSEVW